MRERGNLKRNANTPIDEKLSALHLRIMALQEEQAEQDQETEPAE